MVEKIVKDVIKCCKIALMAFAVAFLIGCIIGLFIKGGNVKAVIIYGCRVVEIVSIIGLAIAALAFAQHDLMRPLNYQMEWEEHFSRLNLSHVIFMIALICAILAYTIETLI